MNVENINEDAREVFKKNKNHIHVMDVPMFSVYIHVNLIKHTDPSQYKFSSTIYSLFNIANKNFPGQLPKDWPNVPNQDAEEILSIAFPEEVEKELKSKLAESKKQINDIGFPSAHSNILIDEFTDAAGKASPKGYMMISIDYIDSNHLINIVTHEWAHLYMFNRSTQFKNAVNNLYKDILAKSKDKFKDPSINPFDIVKPDNLSRTQEDVIIKYWKSIISNIPFILSDLPETKIMLFSKHQFTPELYHHLPHLIEFNGKLKDTTTLSSYNYNTISLPKDSQVYITKGSTGWIIGAKQNNRRYEIVCKPNELENFVSGTNTPSILPDIQNTLNKYINNYIKTRTSSQQSIIKDKLHDHMQSSFKQMMSSIFAYKPSTSDTETIKDYTNEYILPRVYDMLNNPEASALTNRDSIYNYLWVLNPHRPPDASIVKYIERNAYNNIQLQNLKQDLDKPEFTGPSFEKHRSILQKLSNWINSYGMSNNLELWSTAVEYFFKLPNNYKKDIIKLMPLSE